jgi:hypothetical protein
MPVALAESIRKNTILVHFLTVLTIAVKKVVEKITISSAGTCTLTESLGKPNSQNLLLWGTFKDLSETHS